MNISSLWVIFIRIYTVCYYSHYIWWLSGEESTRQCRRCGFVPWVGKIPWRRKWQSISIYCCLENSVDRGAWWAMVRRVTKSWTQLSTSALFSFSLHAISFLLQFLDILYSYSFLRYLQIISIFYISYTYMSYVSSIHFKYMCVLHICVIIYCFIQFDRLWKNLCHLLKFI